MRCPAPASRWREFAFAFHQVLQAIMPELSLKEMLANWQEISNDLAESPRKRQSQEQIFSKTS
jgi:hypothetical protein